MHIQETIQETIDDIAFQDMSGSMSRILVVKNRKGLYDIYLNGLWCVDFVHEKNALRHTEWIIKRNRN